MVPASVRPDALTLVDDMTCVWAYSGKFSVSRTPYEVIDVQVRTAKAPALLLMEADPEVDAQEFAQAFVGQLAEHLSVLDLKAVQAELATHILKRDEQTRNALGILETLTRKS